MILFICNYPFPDSSGFSNRCKNALKALVSIDKVILLCQRTINANTDSYEINNVSIPKYTFGINHQSIERTTKKNYISGFYELQRASDLFFNFCKTLVQVVSKYSSKKKLKMYVVNSPLTIPVFASFLSLFLPLERACIDFHDLEPEMAQEIKKISKNSLVMRVEYFLEKIICRSFNKIIVTNHSQKNLLIKRTGVSSNRIFVKENIVPLPKIQYDSHINLKKKLSLSEKDFVLMYVSSISYGYTTDGVLELFKYLSLIQKVIPHFRFVIVGGGTGLSVLKNFVEKSSFKDVVIFTGKRSDVSTFIELSDVCIIPWVRGPMTETLLPTKLFEYMAAKKPVIAPLFGEFKQILSDNETGFLYNEYKDIPQILAKLAGNKELREKIGQQGFKYYKSHFVSPEIESRFTTFLQSA